MTGPPGRVVKETLSAAGGHWEITALFLGNPHCVVFFEEIDALDLPRVGLAIERHPVFPRRANVEFVQIVDRRTVRQRTWERGCGETLACGTGAGAVAVAGRLTGYLDVPLRVQLRGGSLVIDWEKEGDPVYATGPAEHVFTAEWPSA
jgi:diaminopimelate epimerase